MDYTRNAGFLLTWHMNNGMTANTNDGSGDHSDQRGDVMFSYGSMGMYTWRGCLSDSLGFLGQVYLLGAGRDVVSSVVRGYMMCCRKDRPVLFFLAQYFVSLLLSLDACCDQDSCTKAAAAQGTPADCGLGPYAVQRMVDAACWLCSGFMCLPAKSWHFACLETSGPAARGTSHGPPEMATRGADPC